MIFPRTSSCRYNDMRYTHKNVSIMRIKTEVWMPQYGSETHWTDFSLQAVTEALHSIVISIFFLRYPENQE